MRTIKTCQCCGAGFLAGTISARFCTETCKGRAYRRRRRGAPEADAHLAVLQPAILEDDEPPAAWMMAPAGTEERFWQGTAIQRRESDGFVNATAMAKANGKHLPHYMANERTRDYIAALAPVVGIPTTDLIHTIQGGTPSLQGTWIHPRLAIDLARWISPAFAVWMDGWFLESLTPALQPARQPLEPGVHVVAASQRGAAMIWHEVVTAEVNAALARLSPRCRTNDGLPVSHHYTFTPATGKLQA